jgi:hypothetical protein
MNETGLRWRGRIGNSKGIAGFVLLFALVFLIVQVERLPTALKNPGEPLAASIEQLVDGTVGSARYVTVSGLAVYDVGYTETEDGRTVADYYVLLDEDALCLIVVKAATADVTARQPENVTLSGMTRGTPADLRDLIRSDIPDFEEVGIETTSELYLAKGQTPPSVTGTVLTTVVLGVIAAMCIACLFFSRIVFVPRPVDVAISLPLEGVQKSGVKATGKFLQLKKLEPTIQTGRRTRRFMSAAANIVPLGQSNLLIYIHHIIRTRLYGVLTVGKSESHWGISLIGDKVIDIEPGKLYGWRDRWALRVRYRGQNNKPQTLFLSFDHPAAQAGIVVMLREMGFAIVV